jgi:outer membrane protein assembly factor BamA
MRTPSSTAAVPFHRIRRKIARQAPARLPRVFLALGLLVVTAEAQGNHYPLESVTLNGTALPESTVLDIAGLQIGAPLDKAAIEQACQTLNESGLFTSLKCHYAAGPNHGYALTLALTDQTALIEAAIDVPGADEDEAWRWLNARYPPFNHKVPVDDTAQRFLANALQQHLKASLNGQPILARMESDLISSSKPLVSFQPETLPKVASITFTGEHAMTSTDLIGLVGRSLQGQGFAPHRFRQILDFNIRPAYEARGMYRMRFSTISLDRSSPAAVAVTVAIDEGPVFTLGDVQLEGENLPVSAMLKAANFNKGQVAGWGEIQRAILQMEAQLKRRGYLEASAAPERILNDAARTLDLRIDFARGPLYHFGQLRIDGLPPALRTQARAHWRMRTGDPLDYDYPNEFLQQFLRDVDSRQFQNFSSKLVYGAGDHVMDVTLTFVPK